MNKILELEITSSENCPPMEIANFCVKVIYEISFLLLIREKGIKNNLFHLEHDGKSDEWLRKTATRNVLSQAFLSEFSLIITIYWVFYASLP